MNTDSSQKPFGWEVELEIQYHNFQTERVTHHWYNCTRTKALWKSNRKAIFTKLHQAHTILKVTPLDETTYIFRYGIPGQRM